jgi:hypothetical protein
MPEQFGKLIGDLPRTSWTVPLRVGVLGIGDVALTSVDA